MQVNTIQAIALSERLYVGRETAAELLEVSTRTIDDAIRAGRLEAFRLGRRILIRRADLIAFAERTSVQRNDG